jgi:2-oxoglutarate ferredoxin oxidoreductase subunit gamma
MHEEIIISGFGGQGALFAGQLLAYAGMGCDKHVTWIPSYGPEMRGGTAHCTVVISDEPIGSPMVRHPSAVLALNLPSLDKYEDLVKPGGLLIYNSSLVSRTVDRGDVRVIPTPANAISLEETAPLLDGKPGDARLANVVMLGALVQATGLIPLQAIETALAEHLPERHRRWLEPNGRALRRGAAIAELALA